MDRELKIKCRQLKLWYDNIRLKIGSDAIESAHKTVVQNRMKQSGQR